jgi:hypothetical protein
LEGIRAHGRNERKSAGNGGNSQRIRRRSNALKSTADVGTTRHPGPRTLASEARDSSMAARGGVPYAASDGEVESPPQRKRSIIVGCATTEPDLGLVRDASGNGKKATAAVMRYGCRRGEPFEGYEPRRGERIRCLASFGSPRWSDSRNAANPRTGSGMQQARSRSMEQTVEVGRNHAGGTRAGGWTPPARRRAFRLSGSGHAAGRTVEGRTWVRTTRGGTRAVGSPSVGWGSSRCASAFGR